VSVAGTARGSDRNMTRPTPHGNGGVPDEVAALAAARHLGAHVVTYRPTLFRRRAALLLALAGGGCLIGALAFVVGGWWPPGLFLAALGGLFLYLLARTPGLAGRQAAQRVDVFEHGFIQADHAGPRADFRWDAIASVCQRVTRNYTRGLPTGTTYLFTVRRADGVTAKLTQVYDGIATLGEIIAREVTRVQLPRALAAIEQGETLTFGDLALDADGVGCAGRGSLPWTEIERVRVDRGYICMRRAGKWLAWSSRPACQIPNVFILLTLADALQRRPPRAGRLRSP
jgi:Family of unknown function (DUF6585)